MLLQACRDVDRVAADHQLPASSGVPAGHDVSGVHADPEADLRAVPALDALREGSEAVAHGERGPNGALGVVLVRLRVAEDGEHGVPGELLGRAAEALDLGVDQVEELPQELADVLRVEQLAERSRAREVGEENGDDAPLLPLVGSVRGAASVLAQGEAAGGAEGRGRRLLGAAAGACLVKRRAAVATKAGVGRVLGATRGAGECHAPSLRRGASVPGASYDRRSLQHESGPTTPTPRKDLQGLDVDQILGAHCLLLHP